MPDVKNRIKFYCNPLFKAYLHFLERVVVRLFIRPDILIRSTYNTMNPTPELVISNFLQGMYLLGQGPEGGLVWRSSPERAIITPDTAHLQKSLKQYMKRDMYTIKTNENFDEVIRGCIREEWTWINESVIDIYADLHAMGYVETMEAYDDEELIGGLWGLKIGRTFSIMSMFHRASRAGSILVGTLVKKLMDGELDMIDSGLMTSNFRRFGARPVSTEILVRKAVHGLKIMNEPYQVQITDAKKHSASFHLQNG